MVQFLSATISKIGKCGYKLEIRWSSFYFFESKEFFVFETRDECEKKLLNIRCRGLLTIDDDEENENT